MFVSGNPEQTDRPAAFACERAYYGQYLCWGHKDDAHRTILAVACAFDAADDDCCVCVRPYH
jgi:hypothetical protein